MRDEDYLARITCIQISESMFQVSQIFTNQDPSACHLSGFVRHVGVTGQTFERATGQPRPGYKREIDSK